MSQVAQFRIERLEEVVAMVGMIPSGLIGALAELNMDALSHHRAHTIQHGSQNFNNPTRAKRFIASRMFRYGRKVPNPSRLEQVEGEGFMASLGRETAGKDGRTFNLTDESLEALEHGGTLHASEQMAVPIGAGLQTAGPYKGQPTRRFVQALQRGEFDVINTSRARGLLVLEMDRRRSRGETIGSRTAIMGILVRRRTQKPMLGFYKAWETILPKHKARYDKAIDMALTAAGRESLEKRNKALEVGRTAFQRTYREWIQADPTNKREARRAAERAAAAARRTALAPKGRA